MKAREGKRGVTFGKREGKENQRGRFHKSLSKNHRDTESQVCLEIPESGVLKVNMVPALYIADFHGAWGPPEKGAHDCF